MHAVSSAASEEKEEGCFEDLGAVEGPAMREDDPPRAAEMARGHAVTPNLCFDSVCRSSASDLRHVKFSAAAKRIKNGSKTDRKRIENGSKTDP